MTFEIVNFVTFETIESASVAEKVCGRTVRKPTVSGDFVNFGASCGRKVSVVVNLNLT